MKIMKIMKIISWLCNISMMSLAVNCVVNAFHNHNFNLPVSYLLAALVLTPLMIGQIVYYRLEFSDKKS